jgi:hypothetical protein
MLSVRSIILRAIALQQRMLTGVSSAIGFEGEQF